MKRLPIVVRRKLESFRPGHIIKSLQGRSIRADYLRLFLGTIIPLVMISIAALFYLSVAEFNSTKRGLEDTARALGAAVDRELLSAITTLQALGTSESIDREDLGLLYKTAKRVLPTQPGWRAIILHDPAGNSIFHTSAAFGRPLPRVTESTSFDQLVNTLKPTPVGLTLGPFSGASIGVRVPVLREGKLKFVLTASIDAARLDEILIQQKLPPDWTGVVYDGKRAQIASNTKFSESRRGDLTGRLIARFPANSSAAWIEGPNHPGEDSYGAFMKAPLSEYYVAIILPKSELKKSWLRSIWVVLVVCFLGFTMTLVTLRYGQRLAEGTQSLINLARDIGTDRPFKTMGPNPIAEIKLIADAMIETAESLKGSRAERDRYEAELKESERRKDEFIATLSHELRNPLAPISNAVEILRALGPPEPTLVWCRDVIDQQVTLMSRLMDDLLDVSRITRDQLQLRKEPMDLRISLRHAIEISHPLIESHGHKLVIDLPENAIPVVGDAGRLTQVFSNLLINAAKYMESNGEIRLRATLGSPPKNHSGDNEAVISVKDNGIGIAPEELPRLFDMFSQVKSALPKAEGGLGIGLSLVKGLVQLHGGSVSVSSDGLGKGSEFTVRLPISNYRQDISNLPHQPLTIPLPKKKVLVVDDNPNQSKTMAILLELMGMDVHVADDGPTALEAVKNFAPDVALIDIGLLGMGGYHLARLIRTLPEAGNIKLIAQTGWGKDEDYEKAKDSEFDYHLKKPIDHKALEAILLK